MNGSQKALKELLIALDNFSDVKIIITKPNSDTDGRIIIQLIDDYAKRRPDKVKAFTSLGQAKYLSAIKHADVVIGNSSSGLTEVPAMKKPTVNIGPRQRGRLKAVSVIDCDEKANAIMAAIKKALSPDFQVRTSVSRTPMVPLSGFGSLALTGGAKAACGTNCFVVDGLDQRSCATAPPPFSYISIMTLYVLPATRSILPLFSMFE